MTASLDKDSSKTSATSKSGQNEMGEKAKRERGAPPHEPTQEQRKQVEALASYGIPQEDIAKVIGICHVTLRKYYRQELDVAEAKANAMVAQSLFKKATSDGTQSVTAAIFWLKTRAGWKETVVNEHSISGSAPLQDGVLGALARIHERG
jgi:hypothetical protein